MRSLLLVGVFAVITLASGRHAEAEPVTLDDVLSSERLTGPLPSALAWSTDGERLGFLWAEREEARRVWVVDRDGTGRRPLGTSHAGQDVSAFVWLADSVVASRGGDLWKVPLDPTGNVQRLTQDGGAKASLSASPDGKAVAYLKDGDVWVVTVDGRRRPRRLTKLSLPGLSKVSLGVYARRDREVGPATWASRTPVIAWAPDSRRLAIHIVDRRKLRKVPFPHYLSDETDPNLMRRTYPGDANESRTVAVVDVRSGRRRALDLPDPTSMMVVNLAWSPEGILLVDRMSDDNTVRELRVTDQRFKTSVVWRDERATRIYTDGASSWSSDGRTLYVTADLEERYRVYAIEPGSEERRAVTPKSADAIGPAMPTPNGEVLYQANAPTPAERQVFSVARDGTVARVTRHVGTHRGSVAPDGRTLATLRSDDVTPAELWITPLDGRKDGVPVQVTSAGARWKNADLIAPRYVRFAGSDTSDTLHAKVWLPKAALDKAVPVLFGPIYVNTVRNRWDGRWGLLQQLLLQRGYAVIQVDVRGSTGYGRAFREKFLFEWGSRDLDDLAAAKAWLGSQPWANTSTTGVFGSSYGGLVSVYSMLSRPDLFDAAVAGAPATDPRFFGSDDVAIARRPKTHPEVFERRASRLAGGLEGHLMIIHGLMDDVVPFKTTAALVEALMKADKNFDLVVAPGATHRWTARPHHARYLIRKLIEFFERHVPVESQR